MRSSWPCRSRSRDGWFAAAVKRVQLADAAAASEAKACGEDAPHAMPRVTPHDLRHTAASLAISAGANVKAVQRMLGHASASMTLDTYADLFDADLDAASPPRSTPLGARQLLTPRCHGT
jgi:integrase